jgi:hypothetical protein
MIDVDPEYLILSYRLTYLGLPDPHESPETYPLTWRINIRATVFADDDSDGEEHSIGSCLVYTVPDAGRIDLFNTLNSVDHELAPFGKVLGVLRPDLLHEAGMRDLGGDLMILSSLQIKPDYRGHWLGHHVLWAILATIGRSVALVALRAGPRIKDDGPEEGTPEHEAAKAKLRSYWETFGFIPVLDGDLGDYLVYFTRPHELSDEVAPL